MAKDHHRRIAARQRHLISLLLLMVAGCARWREHTFEDGGFSIQGPGSPSSESFFEKPHPAVAVTGKQWRWEPLFSGKSYMAMYMGVAIMSPTATYDWDKGLEGTLDGVLRRLEASASSRRAIEFAGRRAREVEATSEKHQKTILMRAFHHDKRFYLVAMGWKAGGDPGADKDRFFDSFLLAQ
jgi:hypothetical protein